MIRYIGCETARDLLDAFIDGELGVEAQVMVESHLRWCRTCTARVEDMASSATSCALDRKRFVGAATTRPLRQCRLKC
jgi:predicted anti-sigma-YlaC factor YlaD